ncbi:molecular chaperone [Pseudomonas syringae]|nr:molecular chaperone [Pseudomonas syringae]MBD8574966.1 molecular chaperone [Pseudomonas syringae]MBD8789594.1 molecular chaperone [Pseudomonas syringae]MBD8800783.1 molecular chaperone [Pseudomonas syringae]MBD8812164.1 molecular chaperone [Pseudomonas syringae]
MLFPFFRSAMLALGCLFVFSAQAGIVLNTTRVIYQGKDKEVSLGVHNSGAGEILLQSWLEPYDPTGVSAQPQDSDLPFMVTPPLAHLQGDGKQLVRIIHAGHGMPSDRESVLWLNVQEIPRSAAENTLQIAVRQRIKLFFRPGGLSGDPALAARQLQWQWLPGGELEVFNPGPFHVSMLRIGAHQGARELARQDSRMIAPRQHWRLPLQSPSASAPVELRFTSINDYGGQETYRATLKGAQAVSASRVDSP